MKKQIAFTVVFILLSHLLPAQSKTDTIGARVNWLGGYVFTYDGKKIRSMHKLSAIIRPDAAALHILRKAKCATAITSSILIADLGFEVAYDIHSFSRPQRKYDPNLFIYTSVGAVIIALPFSISSRINLWKAIKKYNSDLQKTGCNKTKPELYFSFTGSALGVGIRF